MAHETSPLESLGPAAPGPGAPVAPATPPPPERTKVEWSSMTRRELGKSAPVAGRAEPHPTDARVRALIEAGKPKPAQEPQATAAERPSAALAAAARERRALTAEKRALHEARQQEVRRLAEADLAIGRATGKPSRVAEQYVESVARRAQAEAAQMTQQFYTEAAEHVRAAGSKYELVQLLGQADAVPRLIEMHHQRTGQVLSIDDAAEMLEGNLRQQVDLVLGSSYARSGGGVGRGRAEKLWADERPYTERDRIARAKAAMEAVARRNRRSP